MESSKRARWVSALCMSALAAVAGAEEARGGHHEGYHENFIAVFGGFTREGRFENEPALGIEYERRLNRDFGVGLLVERTFAEEDFTVFAVPLAYHRGPLKLFAAPGFEDSDEGRESLLRIGIEYGFEVGAVEIAPQLDVDFVDGENVFVYGISVGIPF